MTVAQITPPASRIEAVAGHVYCLPVVRELPRPVADPRWRPHLVTTSQHPAYAVRRLGRAVLRACWARE